MASLAALGAAGAGVAATASAAAAAASTAASIAVSVEGQKAQAEAAADAAKFRARQTEVAGKLEEKRLRRLNRRRLESSRARFLAFGGLRLEGSPLDALATAASEFERDAINVRRAAGQTSALERFRAQSAARAGKIGAASVALQGTVQVSQTGLQLARF